MKSWLSNHLNWIFQKNNRGLETSCNSSRLFWWATFLFNVAFILSPLFAVTSFALLVQLLWHCRNLMDLISFLYHMVLKPKLPGTLWPPFIDWNDHWNSYLTILVLQRFISFPNNKAQPTCLKPIGPDCTDWIMDQAQ